jgi:hypothetical protein
MHAGNGPDYNNEIYVYNLANNHEQRVTTYPGNDHYPAADGGRHIKRDRVSYSPAPLSGKIMTFNKSRLLDLPSTSYTSSR